MEQDNKKLEKLQKWLDDLAVPNNENEKAHIEHKCLGLLSCYYCQIETAVNGLTWDWTLYE